MKAVVCRAYGGPDLAQIEEVPSPALIPGGVRIRVRACSASFASLLVMEGKHQNRAPLPLTPGTEIAGEVMEVSGNACRFRVGDRVVAGVQSGGYAEEVVAPEHTVFHLPDEVDFDIGAQFPTIYATAYAAFKWRAQMQAGETVLVHGAGGGSGLAAVEVAKAMNARVIATAGSDEKGAAARERGADVVINYRQPDWHKAVLEATAGRGADVIYDPVGGDVFNQSLRCIAPEGRIIPMGFASGVIPSIPANIVLVKNITVIGMYWGYYFGWGKQPVLEGTEEKNRQAFEELFRWVSEGRLRPLVHCVFPLAQFKKALELISSREVMGRVVMRPFS
jgi:NADPH2:quinone reductase